MLLIPFLGLEYTDGPKRVSSPAKVPVKAVNDVCTDVYSHELSFLEHLKCSKELLPIHLLT